MESSAVKNTPIRRIKYLVMLQMGQNIRLFKEKSKAKKTLGIVLPTIAFFVVTGIMTFLLSYVKNSLHISITRELFATVLLIIQAVAILSAMSSMVSLLYTSTDSMLLLSFPCSNDEIFLSKLIVYHFSEIKKSLFFLLPFMIGFGINKGGVAFWLLLIPMFYILTIIPVILGSILSFISLYIKKLFDRYVGLLIFATVLLVGVIFYGAIVLLAKLPDPLRIVAIYGKVLASIQNVCVQITRFSTIYSWIAKSMYGIQVYIWLPVVLGLVAVFGVGAWFLAKLLYFKSVNNAFGGFSKERHKSNTKNAKTIYGSFLHKELLLWTRTPGGMSSAIAMAILMPFVLYVMNYIVNAMNISMTGKYILVAFNIMIMNSLFSAYNANIAAAISREGREFALLKTAPSNTTTIVWAKLTIQAVVNLVILIADISLLKVITNLTNMNLILMFFAVLIMNFAHILWSVQIDINHPKINEYSMKGDGVVDNGNIAKSMIIGFVVGALAATVCLLLLYDSYVSGWVRFYFIIVAYFAARLFLFMRNLKIYFMEIEE